MTVKNYKEKSDLFCKGLEFFFTHPLSAIAQAGPQREVKSIPFLAKVSNC